MSRLITFTIIAEIDNETEFTTTQADKLLSDLEDRIMRTSLDLYDSEYDLEEE